jgi:hypothetical protein
MDELPRDFTKLFDMNMFKFDTDMIPLTIQVFEMLGVPHDPLTLIPPQFECPLPKLAPATFPPAMREPPAPALDQFDLDEHFAKEGLRLAQLTNKCTSGADDLEYYISEVGEILGIMQDLAKGEKSAKHILFHIFKQIVDFKKQDTGKLKNDRHSFNNGVEPGFEHYEAQTKAYEFDETTNNNAHSVVQAVKPVHVSHVDLAPMTSNRSNLQVCFSF